MEVRGSTTLIESFLSQQLGKQASPVPASVRTSSPQSKTSSDGDVINVARDLVVKSAIDAASSKQTRLIKDSTEETDKGYRRTQTFERADGRNFTRIEEFTVTDRSARRTVIQQNVSGSTTRLDEILERQTDGTFRRTQRFTDEAGETNTQIQTGFVSADPFVLSGGNLPPGQPSSSSASNYGALRGTQLDLQA